MGEQVQKKFSLPEIIFSLLFVVVSDVGDIIGTLSAPIPVLGVVLLFLSRAYSIAVWMGVQFWLAMKGERGLFFLAGSILDVFGIPASQTATLIATIVMGNNPKASAIAGTAIVAGAGAITGGSGAGAVKGAMQAVKKSQKVLSRLNADRNNAPIETSSSAPQPSPSNQNQSTSGGATTITSANPTNAISGVTPESFGEEQSIFEQIQSPMKDINSYDPTKKPVNDTINNNETPKKDPRES